MDGVCVCEEVLEADGVAKVDGVAGVAEMADSEAKVDGVAGVDEMADGAVQVDEEADWVGVVRVDVRRGVKMDAMDGEGEGFCVCCFVKEMTEDYKVDLLHHCCCILCPPFDVSVLGC